MDEEFNYEIIEHLEYLTETVTLILEVYKKLINLESSLPNSYEKIKKSLIEELTRLKNIENKELEYFSKDSERASEALDYLEENYEQSKDLMGTDSLLCYTRIHEKLSRIELIEGLKEDFNANKGDVEETKSYKSLRNYGYSEEEAVDLYIKIHALLDSSLSLRYASLLEESTNLDAIKMRLEESFACPNNLEDFLIKYNFGRLPRNLKDELKPSFNINPEAFKEFIRIELDDNILDIVNKINNTKGKYELKQCITLFKTYLLYLDDASLKRVTGLVFAWIQDKELVELLTEHINEAKKLQESQNIDSKSKIGWSL